jgi:hypothetical protein
MLSGVSVHQEKVCLCEMCASELCAPAAANLDQECRQRMQACAPGKKIAVGFDRIITYHQKFMAQERRKILAGLARAELA